MTMNEYNDPNAFDGIVHHNFQANPQATPAQPYTDPHPYGPPAPHHGQPVKTGLTKRGKAALAIGATVLATGGFLTWQHNSAEAAANQAKAQELALQRDQIALQMQKELNKASQNNQKTAATENSQRQKQIDACVSENKGLVGKQLGATLASVISDCQTQYPNSGSTGDAMQEAGSATSTSTGGGIDVTGGLAIGGGVLVLGLYAAARRSRTTTYHNPA
jgi:hypothetical protein